MDYWWKVRKDLLEAKGYISPTTGEIVKLPIEDKIIYSVLLERWLFFKREGRLHYDTQEKIAEMCGVSRKKVVTTVKSFVENGVIEITKGFRGSIVYREVHPLNLHPKKVDNEKDREDNTPHWI